MTALNNITLTTEGWNHISHLSRIIYEKGQWLLEKQNDSSIWELYTDNDPNYIETVDSIETLKYITEQLFK